jgi:hypothetical protein
VKERRTRSRRASEYMNISSNTKQRLRAADVLAKVSKELLDTGFSSHINRSTIPRDRRAHVSAIRNILLALVCTDNRLPIRSGILLHLICLHQGFGGNAPMPMRCSCSRVVFVIRLVRRHAIVIAASDIKSVGSNILLRRVRSRNGECCQPLVAVFHSRE